LRILLKTSISLSSTTTKLKAVKSNNNNHHLRKKIQASTCLPKSSFKSKTLTHSSHSAQALNPKESHQCKSCQGLNQLICQMSSRAKITAKISWSTIIWIQSLMLIRFQGGLKTHSKCLRDPWEAIIDQDQRAEAEDTPLRTSSTKPWPKLCKERTESFSHLSTGEDSNSQALLPSTHHKANSLPQTSTRTWMSKPHSSLKRQRRKLNTPSPTRIWWTLKRVLHSLRIRLMQPQRPSTPMKTFQWDTVHQSEELRTCTHSLRWAHRSRSVSGCNRLRRMISNQTLLNSKDQAWKWTWT